MVRQVKHIEQARWILRSRLQFVTELYPPRTSLRNRSPLPARRMRASPLLSESFRQGRVTLRVVARAQQRARGECRMPRAMLHAAWRRQVAGQARA